MTKVVMPQMGESVTEGTITSWFKQAGEWVEKDESLLLITTDKVDAEVPSPASGYLQEVLFPEGETVEIDTVIAVLGSEANGTQSSEKPSGGKVEPAVVESSQPTSSSPPSRSTKASSADDVEQLRKTRSSPLVRKMAAAHQVDISQLEGSGVSGRVTKADFLSHLESGAKPSAPSQSVKPSSSNRFAYQPTDRDRVEPFNSMRASIADHMVISRETSVHVTTVFEIDMTRVAKLRAKHKEAYAQKDVKLSFMPFIMKAVVEGLRKFPIVNSSVVDNSVVYRPDINLGMAVAVDWGLLVPVIKNADEKSVLGLAKNVSNLAEMARTRKLGPDDLKGGTFTVTNPGVFGSLFGTPIINQPQVAILCVGTITKRPVVIEDDAIAVRSMMYLSLSFDHRVIDGATGDQFMKSIKDYLENFAENLL